uniref:Uncharacterized protein LOC116951011 n=1 Tax=Petromyzon marinus TaxID=7757 RepID=A0AAJ7TYW7_PETMA|nr:uncharacterized protein LOC116951011 [Petromyzon marinus]
MWCVADTDVFPLLMLTHRARCSLLAASRPGWWPRSGSIFAAVVGVVSGNGARDAGPVARCCVIALPLGLICIITTPPHSTFRRAWECAWGVAWEPARGGGAGGGCWWWCHAGRESRKRISSDPDLHVSRLLEPPARAHEGRDRETETERMDSKALLLLLLLFLGLLLLSQASGSPTGFRTCSCWGFASKHKARHVRCVEKGRGGAICKKHVLATIPKGSQLCLNPKWHWVKKLINKVGYCSQ